MPKICSVEGCSSRATGRGMCQKHYMKWYNAQHRCLKYTPKPVSLVGEKWKDIDGYHGLYQVSNFGRVKSLAKSVAYPNGIIHPYPEKLLSVWITPNGYSSIALSKDGDARRVSVHRLVAETFIPNPGKLPQINHLDGDKQNNAVENLEWVTHDENQRHAIEVLHKRVRPVRCVETGETFNSIKDAAAHIHRDRSYLSKSAKAKWRTCGGVHWEYVE